MQNPTDPTQNPEVLTPPPVEPKAEPARRFEVIDTADTEQVTRHEAKDIIDRQSRRAQMASSRAEIGARMIDELPNLTTDDFEARRSMLARFINIDQDVDPRNLENHKRKLLSDAMEMLRLNESPLLADLQSNIPRRESEEDESYKERVLRYIAEVKKPLFELLIDGRLNTDDLNRFLCGGIRFSEQPPEHISHAVASIGATGGLPQLTFYDSFFDDEKNSGRDHIVKHEIGHVIAAQIFERQMDELENIAANPDSPADNLPPHLMMVVAMIRNPEEAARREHRGEGSHLHRELMKLSELQKKEGVDAQELAKVRARLVREILAERVANYFECEGTLDSYAALRFGNIDPKLIKDDDPLFQSEKEMFEAIESGMKDKDQWQFGQSDIFWDDEIYYEPETYLPPSPEIPSSFAAPTKEPRPKSALEKFLSWLTGQNK